MKKSIEVGDTVKNTLTNLVGEVAGYIDDSSLSVICTNKDGQPCVVIGDREYWVKIGEKPKPEPMFLGWQGESLTCPYCSRSIYDIMDGDSSLSFGIGDDLKYCPFCGERVKE